MRAGQLLGSRPTIRPTTASAAGRRGFPTTWCTGPNGKSPWNCTTAPPPTAWRSNGSRSTKDMAASRDSCGGWRPASSGSSAKWHEEGEEDPALCAGLLPAGKEPTLEHGCGNVAEGGTRQSSVAPHGGANEEETRTKIRCLQEPGKKTKKTGASSIEDAPLALQRFRFGGSRGFFRWSSPNPDIGPGPRTGWVSPNQWQIAGPARISSVDRFTNVSRIAHQLRFPPAWRRFASPMGGHGALHCGTRAGQPRQHR